MKFSPEYQAALDYLYSFVDFSMTKMQSFTPETFDLSRMQTLLESMENPQFAYPVVHIAGSKGKGSTAAMIAAVLQESGYKVGLYTSPHMIDFNERIQINGEAIAHERIINLIQQKKETIEAVKKISTFEVATALAFQYFMEEKVDVAVVEVGLGGRLDATNLVKPFLTLITSISLDHTAILGDTLEKIATEKAGIMKRDVPVIIAHQTSEVLTHLKNIAKERGCQAFAADEWVLAVPLKMEINSQAIRYQFATEARDQQLLLPRDPYEISIPLVGKHQIENAASALLAILWLSQHGLKITYSQIISGFSHTRWPGRFEIIHETPLIIIDSAHNPDSAEKLKLLITEVLPGKKVTMIFGASEDKDVYGMLRVLRGIVDHFIFTESVHPRAMPVAKLEEIARELELSCESILPIEEAVRKIITSFTDHNVYIAAGSIFVAAAVKEEVIAYHIKQIHLI
jgi:dihydrofolate synthase / folylpolyglutamate synthase